MQTLALILAVLSIWDYPARQPQHDRLRRQFIAAMRSGETDVMEETCRKGVKLLPDDPTWHYNLACSLAYFKKRENEALDELEKAIDLGFRDPKKIAEDTDLARLKHVPRLAELVAYAEQMKTRPLLTGPMANVAATGIFGEPIALGEQNLVWDFDVGCFEANLKLAKAKDLPWTGDLYMNRDGGHSSIVVTNFPGLTSVRLDQDGHARRMDLVAPNLLLPYPAFVNCSMAITAGPYWRSISRTLVTTEATRLPAMMKMYLGNQIFVTPSNCDTAPVGTNGDVFAAITPYWLTTAGRSWSDLPYVEAALQVSRALPRDTKALAVRRGLLAPTIQVLLRKALRNVKTEEDYLSPKAHPTGLPPNGLDVPRLLKSAAALKPAEIPPLAVLAVKAGPVAKASSWPELTYATAFAWAFVLRTDDEVRIFEIEAKGAEEFAFVQTHGTGVKVEIVRLQPNRVRVTIARKGMTPTNRVDIAVFGRNAGTGWGAPSYISFARMDPKAPYSDPALTVLDQPTAR